MTAAPAIALGYQEPDFRLLVETARDMICRHAPDSRWTYLSPATTALTGWTPEELLGQYPWSFCHPDDLARLHAGDQDLLRAGRAPAGVVYRFRRKDGAYCWLETRTSTAADGPDFHTTSHDVTRREEQQEALARGWRTLEQAQRLAGLGSWEWDLAQGLTWSEQLFRIFGEDPATYLPTVEGYLSHFSEQDRAITRSLAQAALGSGGVFETERQITRGDGVVRVLYEQCSVIFGADGRPRRMYGTTLDITERKLAEAELARVQRELLDTSRRAGMAEIATNVLHNVGNVLNSVNISADLLAERVKASRAGGLAQLAGLLRQHDGGLADFVVNNPRGRHLTPYLERLAAQLGREQADLLSELACLRKNIDHIKDVVAMQQSFARVSGVFERVDLVDLVEDALRLSTEATDRHCLELVRELAALPPVLVQKHQVVQILVNLLRNARDACLASAHPGRTITVRTRSDADQVLVTVSDDGVGIPAEALERIFSYGFTTKPQGHGFGLHAAALAARELGGSLTVHSDGVERGASFTLRLPVLPGGERHG